MTHEIKLKPTKFQELIDEVHTFVVKVDNGEYHIGDKVQVIEIDKENNATGRILHTKIGNIFGRKGLERQYIMKGYVKLHLF